MGAGSLVLGMKLRGIAHLAQVSQTPGVSRDWFLSINIPFLFHVMIQSYHIHGKGSKDIDPENTQYAGLRIKNKKLYVCIAKSMNSLYNIHTKNI